MLSSVAAGPKTDSWTATPATTSVAARPMTSGDNPMANGTRPASSAMATSRDPDPTPNTVYLKRACPARRFAEAQSAWTLNLNRPEDG